MVPEEHTLTRAIETISKNLPIIWEEEIASRASSAIITTKLTPYGRKDVVTDADKAASLRLCELVGNFYPYLSEENIDVSALEKAKDTRILITIDPLDGTKPFADPSFIPEFVKSTNFILKLKKSNLRIAEPISKGTSIIVNFLKYEEGSDTFEGLVCLVYEPPLNGQCGKVWKAERKAYVNNKTSPENQILNTRDSKDFLDNQLKIGISPYLPFLNGNDCLDFYLDKLIEFANQHPEIPIKLIPYGGIGDGIISYLNNQLDFLPLDWSHASIWDGGGAKSVADATSGLATTCTGGTLLLKGDTLTSELRMMHGLHIYRDLPLVNKYATWHQTIVRDNIRKFFDVF